MSVFLGLDLSLNSTTVCIVDAAGGVVWQGKVRSETCGSSRGTS